MFENPRGGRQARNFTKNVLKSLDLKLSSEQIFSFGCPWLLSRFHQINVPLLPFKCVFPYPNLLKIFKDTVTCFYNDHSCVALFQDKFPFDPPFVRVIYPVLTAG